MIKLKIEPIKPNEITEASVLLSRAFIQTPFTSKVVGGNSEKHRKLLEMPFKMMLEKRPGKVMVARDNGQIVGVMHMLKWPDCQKQLMSGPVLIPALIMAGGVVLRARKFRKIWAEHDPKEPHWHIDPLGVDPDRQGQGIGSQLLKYFCEVVDKEKSLAYLETDRPENVRLYNRFGFEVREEAPIFSIQNYKY
jgi:ribosomal protein S18 acetylase RimI-like enzyme